MKNIEEIRSLLSDLSIILKNENELNWSRGINAALKHIQNGSEEEYLLSKSVYKTTCSGSRNFMEFYIKRNDRQEQIEANEKLDFARNKLWNLYDL